MGFLQFILQGGVIQPGQQLAFFHFIAQLDIQFRQFPVDLKGNVRLGGSHEITRSTGFQHEIACTGSGRLESGCCGCGGGCLLRFDIGKCTAANQGDHQNESNPAYPLGRMGEQRWFGWRFFLCTNDGAHYFTSKRFDYDPEYQTDVQILFRTKMNLIEIRC